MRELSGDHNTVFLDPGGGYTRVSICQGSSECILKMGVRWYVNYPLIMLLKILYERGRYRKKEEEGEEDESERV